MRIQFVKLSLAAFLFLSACQASKVDDLDTGEKYRRDVQIFLNKSNLGVEWQIDLANYERCCYVSKKNLHERSMGTQVVVPLRSKRGSRKMRVFLWIDKQGSVLDYMYDQ